MPTKDTTKQKRPYTIRPTQRQIKAAELMVENGGNASKSMREAGYSEETAHTPSKLTESKGFLQIAAELGLTDEFITKAIVDDIKAKPGDRSRELALAIKMRGLERQQIDLNMTAAVITAEYNRETAQAFADYLKQQTTS